MGTYDIVKILSDYEHGRMDVEIALGHSLQHIEQLQAAQTAANAERRELQQRIKTLEDDRTHLPTMQTTLDHLQQLVNRLIAHTGMPARPQHNRKPRRSS